MKESITFFIQTTATRRRVVTVNHIPMKFFKQPKAVAIKVVLMLAFEDPSLCKQEPRGKGPQKDAMLHMENKHLNQDKGYLRTLGLVTTS